MKIDREKAISLFDAKEIKLFSPGLNLPRDRKDQKERFVKINGEYYFCKVRDDYNIINELIGSFFSNQIGLSSIQSKIGYLADDHYVLSKSFYKKGYEYCYPYHLGYKKENLYADYFEKKDDKFINHDFLYKIKEDYGEKILNELLKLIVIDLRMGQLDRNNSNITFCRNKSTNDYSLAPAYDFEDSYAKRFSDFTYENYFFCMKFDEDSVKEFVTKYPNTLEYVRKLSNISISDAISYIESENSCVLNSDEVEHYYNLDKKSIKIFKKV